MCTISSSSLGLTQVFITLPWPLRIMFYQRNSCSLHIHDEMEMEIVWVMAPCRTLKMKPLYFKRCLYLGWYYSSISVSSRCVFFSKGDCGLNSLLTSISLVVITYMSGWCFEVRGVSRPRGESNQACSFSRVNCVPYLWTGRRNCPTCRN